MPVVDTVTQEPGVFGAHQLDELVAFFDHNGYGIVRGLYDEILMLELGSDMARCQRALLSGDLPTRCGTDILDDPDASVAGQRFAHYVCFVTTVSALANQVVHHPTLVDISKRVLGSDAWLLDYERFGVVFQDARPDSGSAYSRIGWHSDFQSGPDLDIWPSFAFTIHLDATSPANGFLRVLPGSHRGSDDGMPAGFEKVRGEIAVYCERGDVLLHDAHLWHAAARATDEGPGAIRRHIRGSWCGGTRLPEGHGVADFVKNARR